MASGAHSRAKCAGAVASIRDVLDAVEGGAKRVLAIAACGQMHGTVLIDFFKPVHVKSLSAHAVRSLIIARKKLVGQRVTLENQIRGLAVVFGIRLPRALTAAFIDRALQPSEGVAGLSAAVRGLIAARTAVMTAVAAVASGAKDGTIIDRKTLTSCHGTISNDLDIEYPIAQKAAYNQLVGRIAASLAGGCGIYQKARRNANRWQGRPRAERSTLPTIRAFVLFHMVRQSAP